MTIMYIVFDSHNVEYSEVHLLPNDSNLWRDRSRVSLVESAAVFIFIEHMHIFKLYF